MQPDAEEQWRQTTFDLPVGAPITGEVTHHAPFGFFVAIDGHPKVNALVLISSFEREGIFRPDVEHFPTVGSRIEAEVSQHVDLTHQVRLIVFPQHRCPL